MKARLVLLLLGVLANPVWASEGEAAEGEGVPKVTYIEMQPPFVANYGSSENGRLHYVKAEISLRVSTPAALAAVEHHMPFLRNQIVMLLSQQTEEAINTNEGKEAFREEALKQVQAVLQKEEGSPMVEDLLVTGFIVQR